MIAYKDRLIHKVYVCYTPDASFSGGNKLACYELTQEGNVFIDKWLNPTKEIS
jgi:hypothetical protein